MVLTYNDLKNIIEGFAENGKIFSNEAQFQFALAQAIKEYFKDGNCEVLLEHLILVKDKKDDDKSEDNKKRIKMYIDIIAKIDNNYYPIELKYKTTDKNIEYQKNDSSKAYTFKQGAEDIGSYDYIKDIYRIEQLVLGKNDKERLTVKFNGNDTDFEEPYFDYTSLGKAIKFEKGFAIIITNDNKYNKEFINDIFQLKKDGSHYYWEQFFLSDNRVLKGNLHWVDTNGDKIEDNNHREKEKIIKSVSAARFNPIILQGRYILKWEKYNVKGYKENSSIKKYPFKYLVVEIPSIGKLNNT